MSQSFLAKIIFPVYQCRLREFLYQELLINKLIQSANFRICLLNMNHRHIFRWIIASDRKCFQLSINIDTGHPDIQLQALP